ncbi:ArsR/SmtB family transcription factor [Phytohabitans kaempferiae]|uniref:ArsR/SmtB family transcription factor n=1 Tax=Phytohabitans kaempferiae TaxID=1620943 RepID=A0ABV6M8E2_9ACTN
MPDLLWLLDQDARPNVGGLRQEELTNAVHAFCRIAVAPYWDRLVSYLEAERTMRGRLVVTGGVESLLVSLHPRAIWKPPVLEIPGKEHGEFHLDGRGLVLIPSVFLAGQTVFIAAQLGSGRPALVFPAPPAPETAPLLWREPDTSSQALAALIGRTRAAVLQELTNSATTGELAQRLGISSAGASQHTTVLRQAGLITTRRNRNSVLHMPTPLGLALLNGWTADDPM